MLELSDRKWADFKLPDIFNISQGKKWITKSEIEENPGNIPLVSCSGTNNGIMGFIDPTGIAKCTVVENKLTIAVSGSAGATFYQGTPTAVNNGVLILSGKNFTSKSAYLFMCTIVGEACKKFNYGMKASQDRVSALIISLPVDDNGQPDYEFMEQYIAEREPDYSWATGCIEPDAEISLSDRGWAEFQIGSLFTVEQGKGKIDRDSLNGDHTGFKIATASTTDNGIIWSKDEQNAKKRSGNTITIGRQTGVAFYQPDEYFETDNILILTNSKINQWSGLFIAGAYNNSTASKFSYGRVASIGKIKVEYINLPITAEGKPDYEFMERYMKSLPFSKVLE